jgi:RND family efflux transporter MFP subunit
MKNSKKYLIWLVIIVLVVGGLVIYRNSKNSKNKVQYITSAATVGTLITTVSGTGNISVNNSANVDPSISGTVENLAVNLGDQVKAGKTLFTIVNSTLDENVTKAYTSYLQSKQGLVNAESQLLTAQNNVNNQSSSSLQAKDQLSLDQANLSLTQDQAQLVSDQTQLTSDQAKNNTAAISLDQNKITVDQDKIAVDQSNVSTATNTLQQDQNSASSNAQILQNQLTSAEQAVTIAQENLSSSLVYYNDQKTIAAERTVTAPISGIVSALNITNGDQLGSSSATGGSSSNSSSVPIIIQDMSSLRTVVQVNEVDAPSIKNGQTVSMTFPAISGLTLTGKVLKINTIGTVASGVVSYGVTVGFDSLDPRLMPQMSVTASITTNVAQNALIVPSTAIQTQNNTSYVQILQNGKPSDITVQTGASNDTETQITSGLTAGEEVITQTIQPSTTTIPASASTSGGFGGIGGGTIRSSGAGAALRSGGF